MRPTKYAAWSARDRGLAEALIEYEDGLCPGCGQPVDHAWDPRSEGEYEAHERTCMACQEKAMKTDGREHKPGHFVTVSRVGTQPQAS